MATKKSSCCLAANVYTRNMGSPNSIHKLIWDNRHYPQWLTECKYNSLKKIKMEFQSWPQFAQINWLWKITKYWQKWDILTETLDRITRHIKALSIKFTKPNYKISIISIISQEIQGGAYVNGKQEKKYFFEESKNLLEIKTLLIKVLGRHSAVKSACSSCRGSNSFPSNSNSRESDSIFWST